jgi:hypothetical protein
VDQNSLAQSPFAVLTFIVAPAVLTNATSVLALSTINRMLRTRERMQDLFRRFEKGDFSSGEGDRLLAQANRVEAQALLLLRALKFIYIALIGFAGAALMTLVGATLAHYQGAFWFRAFSGLGLLLGFIAVAGLVIGCTNLLKATQISFTNIHEEAVAIRQHHARIHTQLRKT